MQWNQHRQYRTYNMDMLMFLPTLALLCIQTHPLVQGNVDWLQKRPLPVVLALRPASLRTFAESFTQSLNNLSFFHLFMYARKVHSVCVVSVLEGDEPIFTQ
jgi:hypothetical protein